MIDFIPNVVPGSPAGSHHATDGEGFEQALTDAVAEQPTQGDGGETTPSTLGMLLGLAGGTDPRLSALHARLGANPQPGGNRADDAVESDGSTGPADRAESPPVPKEATAVPKRPAVAPAATATPAMPEAGVALTALSDSQPEAAPGDPAAGSPAGTPVVSPTPEVRPAPTGAAPLPSELVPAPAGGSGPEPAAAETEGQTAAPRAIASDAALTTGPDIEPGAAQPDGGKPAGGEPAPEQIPASSHETDALSAGRPAGPTPPASAPAAPSPPGPTPVPPAPGPAGAASPEGESQQEGSALRVTDVTRRPTPEPEPAPSAPQPPADSPADPPDHRIPDTRPVEPTQVVDPALRGRAERLASRIEQWAARVEHQPPPHVLTLRTGDSRDALTIRVALESGALRISVDGGRGDDLTWLRAATEQLRARGFDVAGYGDGARRQARPDAWEQDEAASWRPNRPRPTTGTTRDGLRL